MRVSSLFFMGVFLVGILALFPVQGVLAGTGLCQGVPLACASLENVVTGRTLPEIAKFLLEIAAGLSVLFIVWSGILMLISMGDDSQAAKAKWAIIYALIGLLGALLSQAFVGTVAQENLTTVGGAVTAATVIQTAVKFLVNAVNVLFFLAIIFAGIRMLVSHGQPEDFSHAKKVIVWAIIGAVIVNVARTLVRAVLSTFGV